MSSRLQRYRKGRIPFRKNAEFGFQTEDGTTVIATEDGSPTSATRVSGGTSSTKLDDFEAIELGGQRKVSTLETLLEFQREYFGKRITMAGGQRVRLAPYYPWVELRKRTTPLPNIPQYLQAIYEGGSTDYNKKFFASFGFGDDAEPALAIEDNRIPQMFNIANAIFGTEKTGGYKLSSVIVLLRNNGNTQVIFPGKSTTSYQPKRGPVVQFVWTSSVEFQWQDYTSLPGGKIGVNDWGKVTKNTVAKFQQDPETIELIENDTLVTTGIEGIKEKVTTNLELTNSVRVAEDYIVYSWLPSKSNRTQERLGYTIFYFSENPRDNMNDPLTLRYQGHYQLIDRVKELDASAENMRELSMYDADKIRLNPKKRLTQRGRVNKENKRLPRHSNKTRSSSNTRKRHPLLGRKRR